MTPRRKTFVLFSLVTAVAAGGFACTYWILSQQAERYLRSPGPRLYGGLIPLSPETHPEPARPAPAERTSPETVIVRRIFYPDCGDEAVERRAAGVALAGKTAAELARLEPHATMASFSATEVVLLVTASGACPRHAVQRYLGISDGHVAVFQGRPGGGRAKVVEVFDLEAGALPEREVQDLQRGIPVRSDDELKRMLQGYLELVGF